MSFSYERYERQQRRGGPRFNPSPNSPLGYWLPLGLSLAAATIGFATWVWNERKTHSDSDESDEYYEETEEHDQRRDVRNTTTTTTTSAATYASETAQTDTQTRDLTSEDVKVADRGMEQQEDMQEDTFVSRVSGAMRRTPSPQQIFDGASKRVAAGVAAAGAMVGRGLTAIRESDDDFQDHETWSTEAEMRGAANIATETGTSAAAGSTAVSESSRSINVRAPPPTSTSSKKKMAAVVVSAADTSSVWSEAPAGEEVETASILSHLPPEVDHDSIDLVILIYAPHLQSYPLSLLAPRNKSRPETSSVSSYSNISTPAADDEDRTLDLDPVGTDRSSSKYDALQATALQLVSHPTQVLPFTTSTGHVHLLRHLAPSLVYMEESLSGIDGANVKDIEAWVGQIVVVVGGEGLVDTETEDEGTGKGTDHTWWKDSARVGLGKAEVVDSSRFTEDFQRRVAA